MFKFKWEVIDTFNGKTYRAATSKHFSERRAKRRTHYWNKNLGSGPGGRFHVIYRGINGN